MTSLGIALAGVLAVLHMLAGRLRFLDGLPRSRWLSVAGGISVAYVFVQLLPEIAAASDSVSGGGDSPVRPVYMVALAGLAIFYGLERHSRHTGRGDDGDKGGVGDDVRRTGSATRLAFGSYAVYNCVIGYLLIRDHETVAAMVLFAVAMGLHFVVNDHGLRARHRHVYRRVGRWIVSAAILAGAGLGAVAELEEAVVGLLIAFIGGGVVLNVMKEELPAERESSFPAFVVGAVGYSGLLVAVHSAGL